MDQHISVINTSQSHHHHTGSDQVSTHLSHQANLTELSQHRQSLLHTIPHNLATSQSHPTLNISTPSASQHRSSHTIQNCPRTGKLLTHHISTSSKPTSTNFSELANIYFFRRQLYYDAHQENVDDQALPMSKHHQQIHEAPVQDVHTLLSNCCTWETHFLASDDNMLHNCCQG